MSEGVAVELVVIVCDGVCVLLAVRVWLGLCDCVTDGVPVELAVSVALGDCERLDV